MSLTASFWRPSNSFTADDSRELSELLFAAPSDGSPVVGRESGTDEPAPGGGGVAQADATSRRTSSTPDAV